MRSPMDEKTFMAFYKNTVLGYSNNLQRQFADHWKNSTGSLFYQFHTDKNLADILAEKGILEFSETSFQPEFVLNTSLSDAKPIYLVEQGRIFIKFTLQKTYVTSESFEQTDYRYPIVLYFDLPNQCMEIRYDAIKYTDSFDSEIYEKLVVSCIEWTKKELGLPFT